MSGQAELAAAVLAGRTGVRMPSDSGDGSYLVRRLGGNVWVCECRDHTCRHHDCKHIVRLRRRLSELLAASLMRAG